MKVYVTNLLSDKTTLYEGTDHHIEQSILVDHPWTRTPDPEHRGDLDLLLEYLDTASTLLVEVVGAPGGGELAKAEEDLGHASLDEYGQHFETGHPVSVGFVRSTEKSPYLGEKYQQHIEPAGRYMLHNPEPGDLVLGWEKGTVAFRNPLVLHFNHPTGDLEYGPTSWKARLHQTLGAKGPSLAKKLVAMGHDGIVTVHDGSTREIVDLTGRPMAKSQSNLESLSDSPTVQDMLGFNPHVNAAFKAAQFLAGGREPPQKDVLRQLFYEEDADMDSAALRAFGFEVSDENLTSLRAIKALGDFKKSEAPTPTASSVTSATPDGEDVVVGVKRAYSEKEVYEVSLAGKHSTGTLLAHDSETNTTWFLKPGSNGGGAAAGSDQDSSSEAAREAAWYHVAKEWGLFHYFPRAELLLIDKKQYAAVELVPLSFIALERAKVEEPNIARKVLGPLLQDGVLHQWATLEYVCGNPDSHGTNLLVNHEKLEVKLIDHGSAFAGSEFDPGHDKASFVPCYLRAWAPIRFNRLSLESKLAHMPEVSPSVRTRLKKWVEGLDVHQLESILSRYGIDPAPTLARLAKVKEETAELPVDVVVNRLWVTT